MLHRLRPILPFLAAVAIALVLLAADRAGACPNCKEMIAENNEGGDLGGGFFYSILVMMAAPFLLAGGFGGAIYYHTRKHRLGN